MIRRNGACFSIARTTAHATITDGDAAFLPSFFFAFSRAERIASHLASICRFAGTTRLSLRTIVGERAGAIAKIFVFSAGSLAGCSGEDGGDTPAAPESESPLRAEGGSVESP